MSLLQQIEQATGLDNPALCRLLGVSRTHMNHFRNRGQPIPLYIKAHIRTLLSLTPAARKRVVKEHTK